SKTIGVLKDLFKAKIPKIPGTFHGIDTKNLALWRVSIPISDKDNSELPVLLDKVFEKDKNKIGPTIRLSKVFPSEGLVGETFHIIVQRPSP
ncbi:hypothetical protein BGZ95_007776, partial [Linnemannia exigua]